MTQQTETFTPEEAIKNEIELLKLKLEVEHGAVIQAPAEGLMPPEMELAWYNHIVNYEQMCKEAGYTTVRELIGNPAYPPCETLKPEEVANKLNALLDHMYKHGVCFEFMQHEYTPETIYRFVTEELFKEEVCRYRGPGGEGHAVFTYEDFHPNHSYELQSSTEEIMEYLVGENNGDSRWMEFTHEEWILLNQQRFTLHDYAEKIREFKSQYPPFLFGERKIEQIQFDLETKEGKVGGKVQMKEYSIPFTFYFRYDFLWWIHGMDFGLIS
ncbi:MAG TPA: hypothetical protein VNB90_12515 [Cytophagaceae bacterium]|jgi:hypothetical protein|nr:hypothetical protein [Cytophagaceae bacterium]